MLAALIDFVLVYSCFCCLMCVLVLSRPQRRIVIKESSAAADVYKSKHPHVNPSSVVLPHTIHCRAEEY